MNLWNPHNEREQDDDDWNYHYDSDEEREIEFVDLDSEDGEDVEGTERTEVVEHRWRVEHKDVSENSELQESTGAAKASKKTVRSSLAPRYSLRQRRRQLAVTVGFVSLLLVILLGSYAPTRQTLVRTFSIPVTPTSTLVPGIDRFYIAGEPPWGHLLVDGQPVLHLPDPIRSEPPLRLSRGKHSLTWVAAPFPARTCFVAVPPNYRVDSCNLDSFIQANTLNSAWLFSFPVTITDLPFDARNALIQKVQDTLNENPPSETVRTGEVYATNMTPNGLAVAKEPLIATLRYQLDVMDMSSCSKVLIIDNGDCAYEGQDCHIFCTAPQLFAPEITIPPTQMWNVLGVVSYRWDYKTLNGKLVASNQPDQPQGTIPQSHLIPLQITWDGTQWQVISDPSQLDPNIFSGDVETEMEPACASAISNVAGDKSLARVLPGYYSTSWVFNSADNPAVGCVGMVTLQGGMPQTPQQTPAIFLHRFGVFVAANKIAHEYFPKLLVADAYEQELARQIANSYVQTP